MHLGSSLLGARRQRDIIVRLIAVCQRSRAQHIGLHNNSALSSLPLLHADLTVHKQAAHLLGRQQVNRLLDYQLWESTKYNSTHLPFVP